jgi:hypothetical protein
LWTHQEAATKKPPSLPATSGSAFLRRLLPKLSLRHIEGSSPQGTVVSPTRLPDPLESLLMQALVYATRNAMRGSAATVITMTTMTDWSGHRPRELSVVDFDEDRKRISRRAASYANGSSLRTVLRIFA